MYNLEVTAQFPFDLAGTRVKAFAIDEFSTTLYAVTSVPSLIAHQYDPSNPAVPLVRSFRHLSATKKRP